MAVRASAEGLEAYRAELGTNPRVWYKNFHRWTNAFLGGTVAYKDTDECAEAAIVILWSAGVKVAEAVTNNYGDFIFDNLVPGKYEVSVNAPGYLTASRVVDVKESVNLGVLFLEK